MSAIRWHAGWPQKWGDPRREEGLLKMMAVSLLIHLLFFSFAFFSRSLIKIGPVALQSYRVSLVSPGGGAGTGGASPSLGPRPSAPMKMTRANANAPALPPTKSAGSSAPPAPSVFSGPAARSAKPAPQAKETKQDPERLQEWWKKKTGSIKIPPIQPRTVQTPVQEIAKVDLSRRQAKTESPAPPSPSQTVEARSGTATGTAAPSPTPSLPSPGGSIDPSGSAPTGGTSVGGVSIGAIEAGTGSGTGRGVGGTGGAGTGTGNGTGRGVGGTGGGGDPSLFKYPYYLQNMENKISGNWTPPLTAFQEEGADAIIRFQVKKNGQIHSIEVEKSSGNRNFDMAALRAVHNAGSLPPFPDGLSEEQLTVHFSFTMQKGS